MMMNNTLTENQRQENPLFTYMRNLQHQLYNAQRENTHFMYSLMMDAAEEVYTSLA